MLRLMLACTVATITAMASTTASAAIITYNFNGTITQTASAGSSFPVVTPAVLVGQLVPIAITVDTSALGSSGVYGSLMNSPPQGYASPVVSATIGGQNVLGAFTQVTVVAGTSFTIQSTSPQTGSGFSLSLSGAAPGFLPTTAIPATLDPLAFNTASFSLTAFLNPTFDGFSGTINAMPAPASLPVLAVALVGMFVTRRGQRVQPHGH